MIDLNHQPKFHERVTALVDAALQTENAAQDKRRYLGASRLGVACELAATRLAIDPPRIAALRDQLAEGLRLWMEREKLTQAKAAKRLGITQPRISEITRGKVELLSLDYLVLLCAKAGIPVGVRLAA